MGDGKSECGKLYNETKLKEIQQKKKQKINCEYKQETRYEKKTNW